MKEILFYIVILLSNTIQGVTGFAGTILAMPFSLQLVGYEVAVPVLNLLGFLAGIYVFIFNYKHVNWKELLKVIIVMSVTLLIGVFIKDYLFNYQKVMYILLGIIVLVAALQGMYNTFISTGNAKETNRVLMFGLLALSGLVHGMFVCGGPLLISYLTKRIEDKNIFRATISTVWIFLNGMLLVSQAMGGMWTMPVIRTGVYTLPFWICGMAAGSFLVKRMSQKVFLVITYILLFIAAITLFMK